MTAQEFVRYIGPTVQKYARAYGFNYPSAIIAQAMVESGNGNSSLTTKYHNYFGIKWWKGCGKTAVNMKTQEEYIPGVLSNTSASWCVYTSADDSVKGYFDFITKNSRYKNLKTAVSSRHYLELIRADGYATSSTYVETCYYRVTAYNLMQYDLLPEPVKVSYAGVVTASALRVRRGASTSAEMMQVAGHDFLLPKGLCVAFDAELCGWARLAGLDGWVSLQYIKTG